MMGENQDSSLSALARIDERTEWICSTLKQQKERDDDHEKRIRKIEACNNRSEGEAAGLTKAQAMQSAGMGSIGGSATTLIVVKILALIGVGP